MKGKIIGGLFSAALTLAVSVGTYYEGVFPVGYADPVGIPTDCIGETQGAKVGVQRFTREQCVAQYEFRLQETWRKLETCIQRDVTPEQAAALISFADNVGIQATCFSTMVRMLNAGAQPNVWCAQMARWDKATYMGRTVVLPGLTKRRASERALCEGRPLDSNYQPAGVPNGPQPNLTQGQATRIARSGRNRRRHLVAHHQLDRAGTRSARAA